MCSAITYKVRRRRGGGRASPLASLIPRWGRTLGARRLPRRWTRSEIIMGIWVARRWTTLHPLTETGGMILPFSGTFLPVLSLPTSRLQRKETTQGSIPIYPDCVKIQVVIGILINLPRGDFARTHRSDSTRGPEAERRRETPQGTMNKSILWVNGRSRAETKPAGRLTHSRVSSSATNPGGIRKQNEKTQKRITGIDIVHVMRFCRTDCAANLRKMAVLLGSSGIS
jgi:hypothetical protein